MKEKEQEAVLYLKGGTKIYLTREECALLRDSDFFMYMNYGCLDEFYQKYRRNKKVILAAKRYFELSEGVCDIKLPITVYKKVITVDGGDAITELLVPKNAMIIKPYDGGGKYRCNVVEVLSIRSIKGSRYFDRGHSIRNSSFVYEIGKRKRVFLMDRNPFFVCGRGIHFFLTRKEAEEYQYH